MDLLYIGNHFYAERVRSYLGEFIESAYMYTYRLNSDYHK